MVSSTNPGPSSATTANTKPALILSGTFLYATLPAASSVTAGTLAFTSDQGTFTSNGTAWIVSPGIAVPNANNGGTETVSPLVTTGLNVNAANWIVDTGFGNFTGNIFNDPVIAVGYNVDVVAGVKSATPDPWAVGAFFEADYAYNTLAANTIGTVTASASNSTTVLVDSGKAWNPNQWSQWTIYNSTSGGRALIASNTATQITTTAPMVISDGVTAARANQTGDSYLINIRQIEQYFEVYQSTVGGQQRRARPMQFYLDKATMSAQGLLASAGIQSLGNAVASGAPTTFTSTLANHGLPAGTLCYVRFLGMTGGSWANLNTHQYPATVTGANTFTCNINTTGFSTFTSGSFVVEPMIAQIAPPSIVIEPFSSGLQLVLPSWVGFNGTLTDAGSSSDIVYTFADSKFTQYGRQGVNGNNVAFVQVADVGGFPTWQAFTGGASPTALFTITGNENSTSFEIDTYTTSGTGLAATFSLYRPNTTDVACTIGSSNQGYVQGLLNLTNQNQTASRSILNIRGATSQSGDSIDVWDAATGNTTKLFSVNSTGAIGVNSTTPPAKVTGFGTPTGTGVISNFPGATATLAQCSQAIAQLITDIKGIGFYGA